MGEKPRIEKFPFMSIVAVKNTATKNSCICSNSLIDENFVANRNLRLGRNVCIKMAGMLVS